MTVPRDGRAVRLPAADDIARVHPQGSVSATKGKRKEQKQKCGTAQASVLVNGDEERGLNKGRCKRGGSESLQQCTPSCSEIAVLYIITEILDLTAFFLSLYL